MKSEAVVGGSRKARSQDLVQMTAQLRRIEETDAALKIWMLLEYWQPAEEWLQLSAQRQEFAELHVNDFIDQQKRLLVKTLQKDL